MNGWTLGRRLHLFAAGTLAALLAEREIAFLVLGLSLTLLAILRREALRPLLGHSFLVFTVLSLGFGGYLFGPEPFKFSFDGLVLGGVLASRAAVVLTLARWTTIDASPFEFAGLFPGRHGSTFGFTLGIALNALPALQDSARRTWDAVRIRGGTRRHRVRNLRRFALATLANALRRADVTAEVAISRGYSLDRLPTAPTRLIPWTLSVLLVLITFDLMALGIVIQRFR